VAGAPAPAGLDAARVRAQALALACKRGRAAARAEPGLAAALGRDFAAVFARYAASRCGPPPSCSRDDAADFARYLLAADPEHGPAVRQAARRVAGWRLPGLPRGWRIPR
jgi:hypothetical protein